MARWRGTRCCSRSGGAASRCAGRVWQASRARAWPHDPEGAGGGPAPGSRSIADPQRWVYGPAVHRAQSRRCGAACSAASTWVPGQVPGQVPGRQVHRQHRLVGVRDVAVPSVGLLQIVEAAINEPGGPVVERISSQGCQHVSKRLSHRIAAMPATSNRVRDEPKSGQDEPLLVYPHPLQLQDASSVPAWKTGTHFFSACMFQTRMDSALLA